MVKVTAPIVQSIIMVRKRCIDVICGPFPQNKMKFFKIFIFYDFESMLLKSGTHCPILVIPHSICEKCANDLGETQKSKCSSCGNRCKSCDEWSKNKSKLKHEPCKDCGQGKWYSVGLHS